jgi:hypothetical protein
MKKLMVVALVLGAASSAFADGFVCQTRNGSLTIKAYNKTDASEGTRNAAVMVVSDPEIRDGNKTIARFTDAKGTLINGGASYFGKVDLRMSDTSKQGRLIGGTKLGQLESIQLDVDFKYSAPVEAGESLDGTIYLNKRDGSQIALDVECERYLKN